MRLHDSSPDRLDARLYDLIHRGNPGDLAFYRDACAGAREVLELGCGCGRILLHLAGQGFDVTGVDVDRDRLEVARERLDQLDPTVRDRVRLIHADVRSLELGREFDRVTAPYSVLYAMLDDGQLDACLQGVLRHLAADGRFVFDGYELDLTDLPDPDAPDAPPVPLVTVQDGETTVRVFEQASWAPDVRRVDVTYTFHLHTPGAGVRVRHQVVRHRWIPPGELEDRLDRVGMRLLDPPQRRGRPGSAWYTAIAVRAPRR